MPRTDDGAPARGATLIELATALAIVAVLASIAWPSYRSAVLKGQRADARAAILDLLQQQERRATQTGTYLEVATPGATGTPFKTFTGDRPETASHLLAATACAPGTGGVASLQDCVRVTATPGRDDAEVGTLWMESTGARGCDGTARQEPRACWP